MQKSYTSDSNNAILINFYKIEFESEWLYCLKQRHGKFGDIIIHLSQHLDIKFS